jgi:hypothetical protein
LKAIDRSRRLDTLRLILGGALFGAAALTFLLVAVLAPGVPPGDRLAGGMLLFLAAAPLLSPTMLSDNGETSTMRVVVYLVVGIFSVATLRLAWGATSLAELKIDPWWTAIVTAAIGGKAVQSFSEPAKPAAPAAGNLASSSVPTPPPVPPRPSIPEPK